MKYGLSAFNEITILFFIIAIYFLLTIDESELNEKYSVGEFLFFGWIF